MTTIVVVTILGIGLCWFAYRVMYDGGDRGGLAGGTAQWLLVVEAVIGAFAWAQLARTAGSDEVGGAGGGAMYALVLVPAVAFAARSALVRFGTELMLGILGLFAMIPAVAAFVGDTSCASIGSQALRIGYVVLFALIAVGALVVSLAIGWTFRRRPPGVGGIGLGWFAIIESALLASETGASGLGAIGLFVALAAGLFLPIAPEIVLTALGAALVALSMASMAGDAPGCGERSAGMLGFLIGSGAVAVILAVAWNGLVRRRR